MKIDNRIMISNKHTLEDYTSLYLTMDSDEREWKKAKEIIKQRFEENYFRVIRLLTWKREMDENERKVKATLNAFPIMALNCLLIDTFFQFEKGLGSSMWDNPDIPEDENNRRGNKNNYINFLNNELSEIFDKDDSGNSTLAFLFYTRIRCGILHSGQTYGNSMLTCDGWDAVSYIDKNTPTEGIMVNVILFSEELEKYFYEYLAKLEYGEPQTRERFLQKMEYICSLEFDGTTRIN